MRRHGIHRRMATTSIPRRLRFQDGSESKEGGQELLVVERRSLVVLGESGMGKSTLLTMLGQVDGYRVCTARKLVNHPQPADLLGDAITLVVDALDEVAAGRDGAAVDLVVRRLAELGGPAFRVVLSCGRLAGRHVHRGPVCLLRTETARGAPRAVFAGTMP